MSSATSIEIPGYVAGTWDIDPAHTEVGFSARHLVVTKVRGRFTQFSGTIVTAENPLDSSVDIEIDLNSITTNQDQRDGHLRSADFFEVEKHPTMTYKASGARQDGDKFVLDGELTLKGITKVVPLTFELGGFGENPLAGGTVAGFSAHAQINRRDFNVNFDGVKNGIAVVSDKIDIHLEVEANLRQPQA
jgi:polyisoprenoid-binding protein YceI